MFSYIDVLYIRFFLGFVEAAFFPGALVRTPSHKTTCPRILISSIVPSFEMVQTE